MNTSIWYAIRQRHAGLSMLLALAVGVAALVTVSVFGERVTSGLEHGAAKALGGSLVLVADRPIPAPLIERARSLDLRMASSTSFTSMLVSEGETLRTRLVEVKAVDAAYPLLGQLLIDNTPAPAPSAGQVYLAKDALESLQLAKGDKVQLGQLRLEVGGRIDDEPDRISGAFAIGPRVMMAAADLPASGLLGFGSRATYRLHLDGADPALQRFAEHIRQHPVRGLRLESLDETRPELRQALERANNLLRVSGLLALMLAGLAVGIGMQDRLRIQLDAAATLRALGASSRFILGSGLLALLPLALLGSLIGVAGGYLLQGLLPLLLGNLLPNDLPPPSLRPALLGLAAGPLITLAFALPAMLRLQSTPVLRILRRHLEPPTRGPAALLGLGLALVLLLGLLLLIAGPTRLTATISIGALLLGLFLTGLATLPLVLMRRHRLPRMPVALARLAQPGTRTPLVLASMGLGLMALTLAFSLRHDLLGNWAEQLPADAPNRFVINLLQDQHETFHTLLKEAGLPAPTLQPMIRGRLLSIDGRPVTELPLKSGRARALAEREFNLSMAAEHPADNRIIEGPHWSPEQAGEPLLSVEQGLAKQLGLRIGQRLAFDIAGERWEGVIYNLRQVSWDSFNVNVFITTTPGALADHPATWITSFHLPDTQAALADRLVAALPNITIIDIRTALAQVREVIARIEQAVGLVFALVLASAWLVLWQTAAGAVHTRRRETALLRTLGASRPMLRNQLLAEYALLGALAGVLAALAAGLVSAILIRIILDAWLPVSWLPMLVMPVLGALLSALAGWISLRRTLDTPPARILRETM